MKTNNDSDLTAKNLDRLAIFLNNELERQTSLSPQIPDGAHIFYGAETDPELTQDNLKLAARILLGISLGYIEDAPLLMVFEQESGNQLLLDLSGSGQKEHAQTFIENFQEQNQQVMTDKLNTLKAA